MGTDIKSEEVKERVFEEKLKKKIPEVKIEVSEAPPERKHSGSKETYIPGLLFKDTKRARTRSRSSRRRKTDQEETTKGIEKESIDTVKVNEKLEVDSAVNTERNKNISKDITNEGKQEQFENKSKTHDDETKS